LIGTVSKVSMVDQLTDEPTDELVIGRCVRLPDRLPGRLLDRLPDALPTLCAPGVRYHAQRVLGHGAHGVVVRYATLDGRRAVAVKCVTGRAVEAEDQACAVTRAPCLVRQRRIGAVDDSRGRWTLYGMDCHDRALVEDGEDRVECAGRVVTAVARALAAMLPLEYYDVKPANVLRGDRGYVLGDLGSVASRASTLPPPACLRSRYPDYRLSSGMVRGPSTVVYPLNTAWTLLVTYLSVAFGHVVVGDERVSVGRMFAYHRSDIRSAVGGHAWSAAVRMLRRLDDPKARAFEQLLLKISEGRSIDIQSVLALLK
jgi:hypothetical protein